MAEQLPYINLGCGAHFNRQWVNVDFSKSGEGVIAHNLLKGIPFANETFEVVYHSHVLEHFPKNKAPQFISECYRVLKPGGIIRIAVPDLEQIVAHYSRLLALGKADVNNISIREDYDWIITEMYDQTVRNESGGGMLKYLSKETLNNEDFIYSRIGHEGRMIRNSMIDYLNKKPVKTPIGKKIEVKLRSALSIEKYRELLLKILFNKEYQMLQIARFRQSGEVHQWMYDIYSLGNLLKDAGFKNIEQMDFDKSNIPSWKAFGLDGFDNKIRKPDSLFAEAIK